MSKRVLIIGNGFDLDLGLKTSYKDYLESKFFPEENYYSNGLISYIKNQYNKSKWIDIENSIKKYLSETDQFYLKNTDFINRTKKDFNALTDGLLSYLRSIDKEPKYNLREDSVAIKLFQIIDESPLATILSFNYTNLKNMLYKEWSLACKTNIKNIHGSINIGSIILGVEDSFNVKKEFQYVIKSHHPNYTSSNVRNILSKAEEVIFFGHSLGETDYHYFEDFFKDQTGIGNKTDFDSKRIVIFTYDEDSRLEMLYKLRELNERRVNYLYDRNDLEYIVRQNILTQKK